MMEDRAVKNKISGELSYFDFVMGLGLPPKEKVNREAVAGETKVNVEAVTDYNKWIWGKTEEPSKTELIMAFIDGKPTCLVCKKTFSTRDTLKTHCNIHTRERVYSCDVCNKSYSTAWSLKEHKMTHTGEKYPCKICGKQLTKKNNLKIHYRIHDGIKPYSCADCPAKFVVKKDLRPHVMTHMSNRPYHHCSQCPAKYVCANSLRQHEKKAHCVATQ